MTVLQILIVVLAVANFVSFAWGYLRFFVNRGSSGSGQTVIKVASTLSYALVVFALCLPPAAGGAHVWVGIAGLSGSLILFFSTLNANRKKPLSLVYSPDLPQHLNQSGPYRWVRHPFYTSYILAFVSGWIGSGQIWVAVAPVALIAIYIHAARAEEEKFSRSSFADAYREYRRRTGMFFPRIFSRD